MLALLEGVLTIPAGVASSSAALLGFGLDSLIEVGSASAVLWGMAGATKEEKQVREKASLHIVGALLLALAAYIGYLSVTGIMHHEIPHRSPFGMVVLAVALLSMLALRRAKKKVAKQLHSDALNADAKQTEFCAYLSAVALVGVALNALFGLWWTDAGAALVMVPLIVIEGVEAVQGRPCIHE